MTVFPGCNFCEHRNPHNRSGHCLCIRDRGHVGEHSCACGVEWTVSDLPRTPSAAAPDGRPPDLPPVEVPSGDSVKGTA